MVCEKTFSRLVCSGVKYFWIIFSLNIFRSLENGTAENSRKSHFNVLKTIFYIITLISTHIHRIRLQFFQTWDTIYSVWVSTPFQLPWCIINPSENLTKVSKDREKCLFVLTKFKIHSLQLPPIPAAQFLLGHVLHWNRWIFVEPFLYLYMDALNIHGVDLRWEKRASDLVFLAQAMSIQTTKTAQKIVQIKTFFGETREKFCFFYLPIFITHSITYMND